MLEIMTISSAKLFILLIMNNYYRQPTNNPGYSSAQMQIIESNNLIHNIKARGKTRGFKIEPKNIRFAGQDRNEKIYVYMRRHWTENIQWFVRNLMYSAVPFVVAIIANLINLSIPYVTEREYLIILLSYYSFIMTNVFKDFFDWYFDPYIITNQRVLHYEFKPFYGYEVKETSLNSIENVTETSKGLFAGLLGTGTLTVSTEATDDLFVFENIDNPTLVRDILVDLTKIAQKYDGKFN